MNKAQLIERVAEKLQLTKKDAGDAVNCVFDEMIASLCNGDAVKISGFGNFIVKDKAERVARNPMTREQITVPASRKIAFKVSDVLKDTIEK